MESELRKLVIAGAVSLLLFFPVFDAVAQTSLDALTDADHKARFKDFIKDWGDIPEDEKLSYWDGRNKPPGNGDFDEDRIDKDGRFDGDGGDGDGGSDTDRDGDGVPDDEDDDPDDPDVGRPPAYVLVEDLLWTRSFGAAAELDASQTIDTRGYEIEEIRFTYEYRTFTGKARLWLESPPIGNNEVMRVELGSGAPTAAASDGDETILSAIGTSTLTAEWNYEPVSPPQSFTVAVYATYRDYTDE